MHEGVWRRDANRELAAKVTILYVISFYPFTNTISVSPYFINRENEG